MKAVMLMYDSLNRHMLPPYGCDWTHAPNFARLAARSVTFERAFVGSMPCMPARRELHTGRYNFLHRSWGPLEPFDDSMPRQLRDNGVHSHLATDHYHYFENGGATYHTQYSTWDFFRGQEGDPWMGQVADPDMPDHCGQMHRQDMVNRAYMDREELQPQHQTITNGLEFMARNKDEDNWFLQIETFDPHEPFFAQQEYKDLYPSDYSGRHFDWPMYGDITESPEEVQECRRNYAALLSMCDAQLGRVLDAMDEHGLWDDTMLIVNTDHGFLLGEHDQWAKMIQPFFNENANIPLFIWDPRCRRAGKRSDALVQTIDLPATVLEYFGQERPSDMQGIPLRDAVASNAPVRDAALFGLHGGHVCVTDGRYAYHRAPVTANNKPLNNYTLMPTHMRRMFDASELQETTLAPPFDWTKGCNTVCIPTPEWGGINFEKWPTAVYDTEIDPGQLAPIDDTVVEQRMCELMTRLMKENDAPAEQYERMGLPA
jgi:arylsulfatase A-like enzyme